MYTTKNISRQLSTEHKRPCKMVHTLAFPSSDEILHLDWLPPHDTNDTAITYSIAQQN